jgi:hypothetical protein
MRPLVTFKCPFVNLPEWNPGRWGAGLTRDKMKECIWLAPQLMAQFAFLGWTGADHLRHAMWECGMTRKRGRFGKNHDSPALGMVWRRLLRSCP